MTTGSSGGCVLLSCSSLVCFSTVGAPQFQYTKCILDGEIIIYNKRKERFEEFGT